MSRQNYRQNDNSNSEQSLIQMLQERLNEAENSIQDYRDENTVLKCELRELQVQKERKSGWNERFRRRRMLIPIRN